MTRVLILLVLVLLPLSGCIKPVISICSTPQACEFHTCTSPGTCTAQPLELKGAL